jgi:Tfp pilus assembly protein PilZ
VSGAAGENAHPAHSSAGTSKSALFIGQKVHAIESSAVFALLSVELMHFPPKLKCRGRIFFIAKVDSNNQTNGALSKKT